MVVGMTTATDFRHTRIAAARVDVGLTQERLAAAIGVSRGAVQKWEQGLNVPDVSALARIAAATGWPIERFFTQDNSRDATTAKQGVAADHIGA